MLVTLRPACWRPRQPLHGLHGLHRYPEVLAAAAHIGSSKAAETAGMTPRMRGIACMSTGRGAAVAVWLDLA